MSTRFLVSAFNSGSPLIQEDTAFVDGNHLSEYFPAATAATWLDTLTFRTGK